MKPIQIIREPQALTVADLCEALADGDLHAKVEDGFYMINKRDLVRLALRHRSEETEFQPLFQMPELAVPVGG